MRVPWGILLSRVMESGREPECRLEEEDDLEPIEQKEKGNHMSIWVLLLIVVGWVVLQAYILPKFGIST